MTSQASGLTRDPSPLGSCEKRGRTVTPGVSGSRIPSPLCAWGAHRGPPPEGGRASKASERGAATSALDPGLPVAEGPRGRRETEGERRRRRRPSRGGTALRRGEGPWRGSQGVPRESTTGTRGGRTRGARPPPPLRVGSRGVGARAGRDEGRTFGYCTAAAGSVFLAPTLAVPNSHSGAGPRRPRARSTL